MPRKQLISVKEASIQTGITEEIIRKHISSGRIGGEKKNYFLWDEWFIPPKDLDKLKQLAGKKQTEPRHQATVGSGDKVVSVATAPAARETKAEAPECNNTAARRVLHLEAEIDSAFIANTLEEGLRAEGITLEAAQQELGKEDKQQLASLLEDENQKNLQSEKNEIVFLDAPDNEQSTIPPEARPQNRPENWPENWPETWTDYRSKAKTVAEEFLAPLLNRLEVQANLLREKDLLIAEQAAQLRLLPDFQKQTEQSQRLVEEKEKESLQLRQTLTWERKKALIKISAWQSKHIKIEQQIRDTQGQLVAIQDQKESEINSLHSQLSRLQSQVAEMQKPWWKRMFKSNQE